MSTPMPAANCRLLTSNAAAWLRALCSRTCWAWLLGTVLMAGPGPSLSSAPALAGNLKFAGAGFAHEPRGDGFTYGFAIVDGERRDAGVLAVHYHESVDGIVALRADFDEVASIVEKDEVVGAIALGKAVVQFDDRSVEQERPTLLSVGPNQISVIVAAKDGAVGTIDAVVVSGGNNEPAALLPDGSLLLAAVSERLDRDGKLASTAIAAVVSAEDRRGEERKVAGPACGRFGTVVASDSGLVAVDAALERGEITLHGNSIAEMELFGPATVDTPDRTCEGVLEFFAEVEEERVDGAAGESQANRRYLYFAKVASDCGDFVEDGSGFDAIIIDRGGFNR